MPVRARGRERPDMSETSETSGKKILYIDMDNTLVDFPSGIDRVSPALLEQ